MDNTNNKTAVIDKPVTPVSSPVGSVQKEQAPISQIIAASEKQPPIDQEQREAGVKPVSEVPTLTEEHKAVGIEHAGESMPVSTELSNRMGFPMTQEEAKEHLKTSKPNDSIFGKAMVVIREIGKRLTKGK